MRGHARNGAKGLPILGGLVRRYCSFCKIQTLNKVRAILLLLLGYNSKGWQVGISGQLSLKGAHIGKGFPTYGERELR